MTQATQGNGRDPLDRPIFEGVRITWWHVAYALVLLFIAFTRLWDLGARAYCHDESIHAWDSWRLFTGQRYIHNPVYHGPFLYHFTALIYALFGHSDITGRLGTSLIGIGITAMPLLFTRWLGKRGALLTTFLMAISPVLMHRSRFIRHDHFAILANLLLFWAILQYLERRQPKYLYWVAAAVVMGFIGKETSFITYFIFGVFLAAYYAVQLLRRGWRAWRSLPEFDLLVVIGTLVLPLASPFAIKALGHDPLDYSPSGIYFSGAVFMVTLAISAGIGLWWDRRKWAICAGLFYAIFIPFFTSMFTNGNGFATGMVGQLGYWLSQQEVKRGGQPWFYYVVLFPLYEFLPILLAGAAVVLGALRGPRPAEAADEPLPAPSEPAFLSGALTAAEPIEQEPVTERAPALMLLAWWSAMAFIMYSWAGEKMPWLMMHLVTPFTFLGGWSLAHLLRADWRALRAKGALWLLLILPMLIFAGIRVFVTRPMGGSTTEEISGTLAWLSTLVVAIILAALAARFLGRIARGERWRLLGVSAVTILVALTVRFAWMATFINKDVANEFLVYAQGTPDDKIVIDELTNLSHRLTGGLDLEIAYDSEVSWPFVWYLRDFTNAQYFGDKPGGPLDADVVLVGTVNEAATKPFLGDRYYRRGYRLIWWPNQNWYMNMTAKGLWRDLKDPVARKKLWDVVFYRKHDVALSSWPFVNTFAMYVRRDLVQQMWDYGPEALVSGTELPGDVYADKWSARAAVEIWGQPGSGPGQFVNPKGLAVDAAGNTYVADSANHRLVVYDAQGQYVRDWGGQGNAPGQMQEPWGVAVGPDGLIYLADTWNHRIQVFQPDGQYVRGWGQYGEISDPQSYREMFYGPRGIAVDAQGDVYVADTGNKRIVKFDAYGQPLGVVGGEGADEGQMLEPVGVAVSPEGMILVADTWNQRVQVFDAQLNYLEQWRVDAWLGVSVVNKPYLAVDALGDVYLTDPEAYRVLRFDSHGQLLAAWGQFGSDALGMNLPTGIAVAADGRILVTDSENGRVLVFR